MAIYDENTVCSLCDGALDRPFMGLSWFTENLPKEIWQYGDSIMHVDCFDGWEHRKQFSQESFSGWLRIRRKSGSKIGYILLEFERYALVCGPVGPHTEDVTDLVSDIMRHFSGWRADAPAPLYTDILLRDWDMRLRSNWYDWNDFINGGYQQQYDGLSQHSKSEIDKIVADLRCRVPDLDSLSAKLSEKMSDSNNDGS